MIPFKSGVFVSKKDFCGRENEITRLQNHLSSNSRVYIQGERRIGKSSLAREAIYRSRKKKLLYIDFLGVKSENDVYRKVLAGILSFENNDQFIIKMIKNFAALRPTISLDPLTGQPSLGIDTSKKIPSESLEQMFDVISTFKNAAVIFDEFQDLLNLSHPERITATIRSKIQSHQHIPYIFIGSLRNKMYFIFNDPESPFYKSAQCLEIGPLNKKIFTTYINKRFKLGKREASNKTIELIMDEVNEIPGDVQRLCYAIWEISTYGEKIVPEHINKALLNICQMEAKMYELIVLSLSSQQTQCLKTLAKVGIATGVTKNFIEQTNITLPASIHKALNRLVERRLVIKIGGKYKICDPFFSVWLRRQV